LRAGGHDIFVHQTPAFSLAAFEFSGDVEVAVAAAVPIESVAIRPSALGIVPQVEGQTVRFRLGRPCHLSIEINGDLQRPLLLMADAPESDPPKPDDPGVRYFAGGQVHEAGEIRLEDDQTLYLAGGAVVRGVIRAEGVRGARVLGRGILDGTPRTTKAQMVALTGCKDVEINGPIFLGSHGWTLVPKQCEDVRIVNAKVLSWRDNDDGLDIVSSRRVLVDRCFFRTKDDCIAVKAQGGESFGYEIAGDSANSGTDAAADRFDVRDVLVRSSVFWNAEWGNGIEIGYELRASRVHDIRFEDCDIIREQRGAAISIHNGDFAAVENVAFNDIRVEDATGKLIDLHLGLSIYSLDCPREYSRSNPQRKPPPGGGPWLRLSAAESERFAAGRGQIRGIRFSNISVSAGELPPSLIQGYGPNHQVCDVCFENVTWRGQVLGDAAAARLTMDQAADVTFVKTESAAKVSAGTPPAVIFDTDMGSDCDDAGALAILHALADAGEVRLLGVIFSSGRNRYGVGTCDAINTYYGRGDLPLGQYQGTDVGDPQDSYTRRIATSTERFGHDVVDKAPDLVSVYRQILERQPDQGVTIVTVGHPHGLVHLLRDPRGAELVRTKVGRWVAMGMGGWNFEQMGMSAYTEELLAKWPTPFYVSPEGEKIITGSRLLPQTPENNPVREAYRLWNNALGTGRSSWDQVAVLSLVRPELFHVESTGRLEWSDAKTVVWNREVDNPRHHLVTPKVSNDEMQQIIEELMARPPKLPRAAR
jgi:hypothetical protein